MVHVAKLIFQNRLDKTLYLKNWLVPSKLDRILHIRHKTDFLPSHRTEFHNHLFKGELQRQNMLISFESPSKIFQIETKIIKTRPAVLQIFNFKDQDLDSFPIKKTTEKPKNVFRGFAKAEERWILWHKKR